MFRELNNLKLFFEEPEREFHLRELSRLMKKNPVTIKKALAPFVDKNILGVKRERGLELYSSNVENKDYKEYKKIFNRLRLFESGLVEYIGKELNFPVIVLFGSFSRGEDNMFGDVDIFILTETKKNLFLSKFEKKFKRNIQLHIMNKKEFELNKKKNPELINSIVNGEVLTAFLEVL